MGNIIDLICCDANRFIDNYSDNDEASSSSSEDDECISILFNNTYSNEWGNL